jgi:hypothetical protein
VLFFYDWPSHALFLIADAESFFYWNQVKSGGVLGTGDKNKKYEKFSLKEEF